MNDGGRCRRRPHVAGAKAIAGPRVAIRVAIIGGGNPKAG